jgi:hypothetical protein
LWENWAGHCIGNVVVVKLNVNSPRGQIVLKHEQEHARQCMALGIFQPIVYVTCYLVIKFAFNESHPYFSNPFEVEARRVAGQPVDIEGLSKKIKEKQSLSTDVK